MKVFPALLCGAALLALGYCVAGPSGKDEQADSRSYRSLDECLADAASLGDRQLCKDTYDAVMADTTVVPTYQTQAACEGEFSAGGCRQISNSSLWGPLLTGFMISRMMDHRRPVYSAMPLYKPWQDQPRKDSNRSWWPSSYSSVPYTSSSSSYSSPPARLSSPFSSPSSSSSPGSRRSNSAASPATSTIDSVPSYTDSVPSYTDSAPSYTDSAASNMGSSNRNTGSSTSSSRPRSSISAWGIFGTPKASNDNSSDASSSRKSSPVGIASPSVSRGGFGSSASSSASRGG